MELRRHHLNSKTFSKKLGSNISKKSFTSSVSPQLLQRFACYLAPLAFSRIMALLSIIEELSVKRQILAFLKGFCEKANFGQNSAKICLCSQNLPFHRIIETCLKTGIFVPSGTPSTFQMKVIVKGLKSLSKRIIEATKSLATL